MKKIALIMLALLLTACGGGGGNEPSEEDLFREQALAEMRHICKTKNNSGIESWEWHDSYYPYGPKKGEVFARGWSVVCAPNDKGIRFHYPKYPPVI